MSVVESRRAKVGPRGAVGKARRRVAPELISDLEVYDFATEK